MTDRNLAILGMVGGIMAIVGSLLPWATVTTGFGQISVNGTQGDGVISLILGAVIALAGFLRYGGGHRDLGFIIGLLGVLVVLLGGYDYLNVSGRSVPSSVLSNVGVGLYVVILGGVAAVLSARRGT